MKLRSQACSGANRESFIHRSWIRHTFAMNRAAYVSLTTALVDRGVHALERGAWFLSSEHDETVIDQTGN